MEVFGSRCVQRGWFIDLAQQVPLAVATMVVRESVFFKRPDGTRAAIDLTALFDQGLLNREEATLGELANFTASRPRSGLGSGETESLAIVHGRGLRFCTADVRAMKVMKLLGSVPAGDRWKACSLQLGSTPVHLATNGRTTPGQAIDSLREVSRARLRVFLASRIRTQRHSGRGEPARR